MRATLTQAPNPRGVGAAVGTVVRAAVEAYTPVDADPSGRYDSPTGRDSPFA
jgi:hypothetical protein